MGSIIHSHAVHFFALAGPDLLLGIEADKATRNIVALLQAFPEVAKGGLELRSIGQRVTEVIGGRGTHPVAALAGGMATPLSKERHATLQHLAQKALPLARELVLVARDALLSKQELLVSLPLETYYMGTVKDGCLDLYDGLLRLRSPGGSAVDFAEDEWTSYLHEETTAVSYAKHVLCRSAEGPSVPYRVGALARLNCADRIDTPEANEELQRFREFGGSPCHHTVLYHYARLIELLYACEKLVALIDDPEILSDNVRSVSKATPTRATAHVEAPRGVLIHDYDVDANGIVTSANLLVATQQNIAAINDTIAMSAGQYLDRPDDALLNGIEFGIRCYDPCLSCATHRLGEMRLDVVVRKNGDEVRRARR